MNQLSLVNRFLFLGLSLLIHTQNGWSQPTNSHVGDVVMPTPSATSFGKYVDVPVSYFTGISNNTIPLYTVSDGKVSLPISLSYHSAGIKLATLSSWTGNWDLSAGGMITRTILDRADDDALGYYRNGQFLEDNQLEAIINSRDEEPDLFSFSLPNGTSGRFYFTGDGPGMVEFVPKQDLKLVESTENNGPFLGFTIIDKDGTKYFFGQDPTDNRVAQERTINQGDMERISSWYLLRIQSYDGIDNITLDYQTENYSYVTPSSCQINYTGCGGVGYSGWSASQSCVGSSYDANHFFTTTQVTRGLRLATITSPTETITFAANTAREDVNGTSYRLDSLSISSGTKFCKRFRFAYDYFKDPAFPVNQRSESKRLRLLSVQEVSCTGTYIEIPPYSFEYDGPLNTDGSPYLPQRLDKATDEWGFFNGQFTNNNLPINLPEDTRLTLPNGRILIEGQANRNPSLTHTQYGILTKINNPLGGSVEFEYELNDYYGQIQGEETTLVPEIRSCPNPLELQCCGAHDETTITPYTFTSQGEIDRAYFTAVLTKIVDDAGDGSIDCNLPLPTLNIRALEVTDPNNPIQRGFYSFNLNSSQQFEIRDDVPLTNLGALSLNVPYIFEVSSNNGQARFALFTIQDEFFATRPAGGLRIRKITAKDGQNLNPDVIKTFEYKNENLPNESSGILYQIPRYAYFVDGQSITAGGLVEGAVEAAYFTDNSIVPLGGYDGISLGYQNVREILGNSESDNGYNTYTFFGSFDPIFNFVNQFPRPPAQLNVYKGKSDRTSAFKVEANQATLVNQSAVTPRTIISTNSPNLIIKTAPPIVCGQQTWYFHRTYQNISPNQFQKSVVTSFRDGVSTQMVYEYDNLNRHLAPVGVSMTNSDDLKFITEHRYPFDFTQTVYDSMVARNQIATPIETIHKVEENGTALQTKGQRLNCDFFDNFGLRGGSGLDPIYPYLFEDYEMTWDAGGNLQVTGPNSGWDTLEHHGAYNMAVGRPANSTSKGWETEFYTYDAINKQIKTRTFENFQWVANYFTGTRIASETIDIDAQDTDFDFDPLMRLIQINERDGNVLTDISYQYQDGTNTHNFINQKVTFQPDGLNLSALQAIETRQYLGGLGRLLQTNQIKHSPDAADPKDIITAVSYDNQSRVAMAYEPFESLLSNGSFRTVPNGTAFTVTQYEVSPLNRPVAVTPPDWYTTHTLYGSNQTAITVPGTSITYAIGELNTITTIEPDGSSTQTGDRSTILSDKRGKPILLRQQNQSGSSQTSTYTIYDKKERETIIIPPAASATDANLIFTTLYSGEDNKLEIKIPDKEKTTLVYEPRNIPIAFQDGNLRTDGKWMITQYDVYGRVTKTGLNTTPTTVNEVWTENYYDGLRPNNSLTGFTNPSIDIGRLTALNNYVLNGNQVSNTFIERFYFYDDFGRMITDSGNNHRNGLLQRFMNYDYLDNVVKTRRRYHISAFNSQRDTITQSYDHQGRPIDTHHNLQNGTSQHLCRKAYDHKDLLLKEFLSGTTNGFLQECNYTYLENRFLKGINETMAADDLFSLQIAYDQGITPQYEGNIASLTWEFKDGQSQIYDYQYDFLNRLTAANYNLHNNAYGTTYSYDLRGNINSLTRRGLYGNSSNLQTQQIDNLSYSYVTGTNRLKAIADTAPCPTSKLVDNPLDNTQLHAVEEMLEANNVVNANAAITYQAGDSIVLKPGFHAKSGAIFTAKIANCPQGGFETDGFVQRSSADYDYDNNGNQTIDPNKGIQISYNYHNLPYQVSFANGSKIDWLYDGEGKKLQKQTTGKQQNMLNQLVDTILLTQDYFDDIEYSNDTLEALYFDVGRLFFGNSSPYYEYAIKDHLKNQRVLFSDKNTDGTIDNTEISETSSYYPYGLRQRGSGLRVNPTYDYLFNGFERNADFGFGLDFAKYRTYNPTTARWLQVDPEAGLFTGWTPYKFGMNNPVLFNDPNGDCEVCKEALINSAVFVAGVANSISSNLTGNFPGTRGNPNDFGKYAQAAAIGQQTGDVLSLVAGTAGTILGTVAATGSSLTTPVTGPVGAGAAVALGTGAAASAGVATTAFNNLTGNNAIVNMKTGSKGGPKEGKSFTKKQKSEAKQENIKNNDGEFRCADCDVQLVDAKKSQKGVKPPGNEAQYDHIYPKKHGGNTTSDNRQILCRDCNRKKSDKLPEDYYNN